MKKIAPLFFMLFLSACDLQPKIVSLPDSVGDFITNRYPALLADPKSESEIYNSAAADYGMYMDAGIYGGYGGVDDYIMYASANDYNAPGSITPVQTAMTKETPLSQTPATNDYLSVPIYTATPDLPPMEKSDFIIVNTGDTLYSLSRKYSVPLNDLIDINNLTPPYKLSPGQKLNMTAVAKSRAIIPSAIQTSPATNALPAPTQHKIIDVKIAAGDTLYSLSRKYSLPVNDLAVLNKLSPPFNMSIGQIIKVPMPVISEIPGAPQTMIRAPKPEIKTPAKKPVYGPTPNAPVAPIKVSPPKAAAPIKISSDPNRELPKIGARSSSKFSWPIRGLVVSTYGAKSNGLFNDGINIANDLGAKIGAAENGVVAYAGNEVKGMGNLVIIQHTDGFMTVYAHMDKISLRRGVRVIVGQQVGTIGQTGNVRSPQLHFEIRQGKKAFDPTKYLKK